MLEEAEFKGEAIDEKQARAIIDEARELLDRASYCAAYPAGCAYFHRLDY